MQTGDPAADRIIDTQSLLLVNVIEVITPGLRARVEIKVELQFVGFVF